MSRTTLFWKKSPFVKLVLATIAGILFQFYFELPIGTIAIILTASFCALVAFSFFPLFNRYKFRFLSGIFVKTLFVAFGSFLVWKQDIRNKKNWLGNNRDQSFLVGTITEPLSEKQNSFKALARIEFQLLNNSIEKCRGKLICYFKKDSTLKLQYGSQIIFKNKVQPIKNSGNPGAFDYRQYCLFNQITHQVYLVKTDLEILPASNANWFTSFIYKSKQKIIEIIRKHIPGRQEQGLAEALLIGYRDDLDKNLVQAYSKTGVVHIIAISGLHLGLIYFLLSIFTRNLFKKKQVSWLRPVVIISCLWLFSILAGAQPSILRSAVMFTCLVLGEAFSKRTSVYNTMAVSAFVLLIINPFWLWDIGFQLSYTAVLSIIIFMKPIYNLVYVRNKLLDLVWKFNAVTLAAQILTVPLCIYHFHQFPNLFLLSNFIAVPLSSLILLGEILLCLVSFLSFLAFPLGKILSWLIAFMNGFIERIAGMEFSVSDNLQVSFLQMILLFTCIIGICCWLMRSSVPALKIALTGFLAFILIRSFSVMQADKQKKIIVYNVPGKSAIDFIDGRKCQFLGNKDVYENTGLFNFHLKPARVKNRILQEKVLFNQTDSVPAALFLNYYGKRIMQIKESTSFKAAAEKINIDLLIISNNPKIYMKRIITFINVKTLILDSSIPSWKGNLIKRDCDSLNIPCHDVSNSGAFVMKLQ